MTLKRVAQLSAGLALAWAAIALGESLWHGRIRLDSLPLADALRIAATGACAGLLAAGLLAALLALAPRRAPGAALGHLALLPPAVQGGHWLAAHLAHQGGMQALGLALPAPLALGAGFALAAGLLVTAGSIAGMLAQAIVELPFVPLRGTVFAARIVAALARMGSVRLTLLALLLAGAFAYAEREGRIPWPAPEPPALSPWIEEEKSIVRSALGRGRYAVLVLPVQVNGPSFDRAERSMMTRYLAARIAQRTGESIPDPTLVARALDARARTVAHAEAVKLANSIQASLMLEANVQRSADTFRVRARLWEFDAGPKLWRETRNAVLDGLRYDDQTPPALALRAAIDSLLDDLKIRAPAAAPPAGAPAPAAVPGRATPADLFAYAREPVAAPLERALRLQAFAGLHERESLEAQLLWERSLIAIAQAEEADALRPVLEARAWMHLQRRPYALARLGEPATPEARALLAMLNGDLPGAEAAIETIARPELRLAAEFELADLYAAFGMQPRRELRREALAARAWAEAMPVARRMAPELAAGPAVHEQVYTALESRIPGTIDARLDTALAWLRWFYWLPEIESGEGLWLARLVERNRGRLWLARGDDWIAQPAADRLAEWDYYDLMLGLNRSNALATLRSTLELARDVERAEAMLATLGAVLDGYPEYLVLHAAVLGKTTAAAPARAERLVLRSRALAFAACAREGGESRIALEAERLHGERGCPVALDEPARPYRSAPVRAPRDAKDAAAQKELQEDIVQAHRRLAYADRDPRTLAALVQLLRHAGREAEAQEVLAQNRGRFIGAPLRAMLYGEKAAGAAGFPLVAR